MNLMQRLTNPMLSKEFRLRMRSKRTPWAISLYLLILGGIIFTFIYLYNMNQGYFNPQRSREIFMMLSIFQFAMVSFVTPGLTAGTVSGERERQTLNILLTTNLSPTKIIVGKWLSSLSFMIFLVVASIPLYSIVFLYGGISPIQLIKVFGFYLISMLAIGGLGILFSTLFKRTGVATVITYAAIIGYTVGTYIIASVIQGFSYQMTNISKTTATYWMHLLYSINPLSAILSIFNEGPVRYYGGMPNNVPNLPLDPYWMFISFFSFITIISILFAIYAIKPVRRKLWRRK